jgi:hypothetical protein
MPLKFVKGTGLQSTSQLRLLTPLILFPQYPTLSPDYDPLLYAPPQFQDPQMKQASFLPPTLASPISPMISLMCVLFFSFLATKSLGADDPRFLACSVPKACGDGQNITFPFYIQHTQEKYSCGHRGFQISCNQNGQPTIIMGDINYTIHKIFYQNQTLRVSNAAFTNSNGTGCFPLIKNIPSSLVRFELVPKQSNLSLFYNCNNSSLLHSDDLQSYAGCDGENVVALSEDDPKLVNVSKECTTPVVAPVEAYGGESDGIRGALKNGFWLKWKASNCSICDNSGGFCGFVVDDNNVNYSPQCFCADGAHYVGCKNPGQFSLSLSKLIFLFLSLRNLIKLAGRIMSTCL